MTRKLPPLLILVLVLVLALAGLSTGVASAQAMPALDLPPGIADQAQPHLEAMMAHMEQMGMSEMEMEMMMADMQIMADQLPPGIFLQLLQLMPELMMEEMMSLHQQLHQGDLLQQPPGEILLAVQALAG
ncbi:MAG: hypothetical protein RQ826_17335 [Xanthomonadales bacterium]|nr:hypothetical protein [Xanthomonadales bacterium]